MLAGRRLVFTIILGLVAASAAVSARVAEAQSLPAIPQSLLDQLQRQQGGDSNEISVQQPLSTGQDRNGTGQNGQNGLNTQQNPYGVGNGQSNALNQSQFVQSLPATPLERDYSSRASTQLRLFGRDLFSRPTFGATGMVTGAIRDTYVMGFGDEIVATLRGQVSRTYRTRVGRDGQVVLPDLPPVPAVGRSFGDFRTDLDAVVKRSYVNTDAFVSLGEVRRITVLVTGEVKNPGQAQLSAFGTVVDALSGQLTQGASLRNVTLTRDGQTKTLDLYALLTTTKSDIDIKLTEGDQISVAPLGATIAVAGDIARPAIYEIPRGGIATRALVDLAGGFLRPAGNRLIRVSFDASGRQRTTEIQENARVTLQPGDLLMVGKREDIQVDQVSLFGRVRVPGERALAQAHSVRALIGNGTSFGLDPYLPLAVLITVDPVSQVRHMESVDLAAVLSGTRDYPLHSLDTLIVLGKDDVAYLSSSDVQSVLVGQTPPSLLANRPLVAGESALIQRSEPGLIASTTDGRPSFWQQQGSQAQSAQQSGQSSLPQMQQRQVDAYDINGQPLQPQNVAPVYTDPYLVSSWPRSTNDPGVDADPQPFDQNGSPLPRPMARLPERRGCPALQELASIVQSDSGGRFNNAVQLASNGASGVITQSVLPCPTIMGRYPDLLPFLVEHAITVRGEVRRPGIYPVGEATLAEVEQAAGGVTRAADFKNIEVSHFTIDGAQGRANVDRQTLSLARADFARVPLFTGDVVHFNSVYDRRDTGPVVLAGEFKQAGLFDIRRGEKLSEVVRRAGGLTDDAYPYGAVLTRVSAQRTEQEGLDRSVRQVDAGLTAAVANASSATASSSASTIASLQAAVTELKATKPVGRVVFEADPTTLASRPDLDIILEPGDKISMPKRPSSVAVTGDVLNPSSQQFEPGLSPQEYVRRAGGYLQTADEDHVFIVLPNGAAEPVSSSMWNFSKTAVPPGSTIVVPRDLSPDTLSVIRDVTQVLSQIAITAASLAVINN
ncbi:MAG TPA: SLBB domain-containing protein [Aliidongia sp.]|uniref:polysaccharide biosynthesis/export family protein n=1 Tax=Aliidongia sp. TaxID=1914230 RepID=UPI002DDCEA11|nr:SLBB domain-containing protein [Aliidongia sp.]HEV2674629.1 SLBB domain-containing protein [Aliidongia sp.]